MKSQSNLDLNHRWNRWQNSQLTWANRWVRPNHANSSRRDRGPPRTGLGPWGGEATL